ncbi:MAG: prepilin-type N-terminal cleavage/methylation domain-containing protein [Gammaproteobacteria bacterium]|nr:prepilin-type N-terminal cleavage/methylation domain-containing protein [Gammaproteobacteria bacterium]
MRGYTLIEVIVAFAVLALALTLLLGTLSGAARLVRQADDGGRAALYAQSLLDQAGVGSALQPGRQQGEFEDGRYRWTLEVAPYVDPGAPILASPGNAGAQLFELVLQIDWGAGAAQRLQLRSLRLSQPDTVPSAVLP